MSEFDYKPNQNAPENGEYHYSYINRTTPTEPQPPRKKKEKRYGIGALIAVALCSALLCGTVASGGMYLLMKGTTTPEGSSSVPMGNLSSTMPGDSVSSQTPVVNQTTNITVNETAGSVAQAVAAKCTDSVVGIRVTATVTSTNIFGQQSQSQVQSDGSGVIYTADGYVITNYHVISAAVENASYGSTAKGAKITVHLATDAENGIEAMVVGYDASADLALLKIERTGLPAAEIGNSETLVVGQTTIAIGSPGGLDYMGSVSQGIVSGLNRSITTESGVQMNLIQTDAAINPGNSGGALFNETGKLIGINNAKMSGSDYDGIGFAIPVNEVVEICERLIRQEGGAQAYLGVTINTYYTADRLSMMGYPTGVVVYSVAEGSPAEEAGLQEGDLITEFNGTAISSYAAMISEKNKYEAGDTVTLKVLRGRQYYEVEVTLR